EQAHIAVGLAGIPISHPDRHALGLLNTILGNGMASRLFLNLREEKGLVYDVHSSVSHLRDCGAVVVYAGADPKRAKDAVEAIVSELNRATKDLTQQELSRARELSKGRLFLGMEDTRSVAWWLGSQEMFLDRIYSVDEVAQQLDALTLDDLVRAGEELFQPENYRTTIVGPFRSEAPFRRILGDSAKLDGRHRPA
ncbi:MAG: insulinase family protein, partial [Chloroflexi bacterium]|nr:insulinase family protein [Chloroflexota bacterium]